MRCGRCGTQNEEGRRFCLECGARLSPGCPSCGAQNPPEAKFCGDCGTALTLAAAGSATAPAVGDGSSTAQGMATPTAERRLVSVLFADLVGFTPFSEERDAEDVRETLGRYFDVAREVVGRYGGTIEKFIGDAVMAVWGTPTSREDDAERAVRAAIDLVAAVPSLGDGLEARAGIVTGEAAVSVGATDQAMVAGDIVNTASRLQAAAEPGVVLVGESTMRAASEAVAYESVGPLALKGLVAPVPAWKALRVVAERGGRGRSEGLEAPFVGRDTEFRMLKELFHATGRERRVRVVSVTGQGGIGKSRLAWELEKYVDGLVETVWWHRGRSPAYGSGVTFWALGEMVRGRCGLAELDDEATTRSRVAVTLADLLPEPEEREWVEPAILALLGVGEAPASGTELSFPAWRTFFERIAAGGTVAMVFEDLQWADPGLVDFIEHLASWSRDLPIFVVTLARPEFLEAHPEWGIGQPGFTSIALAPLDDEAMRSLLAGLVPGLPGQAIDRIVARADGIPMYAVETVRMLLADGRLVLEDGVCRPVGDLTRLDVPESLRSLIASRLDSLDPAERALVQSSAVLGQTFAIGSVAAVSGIPEAELEPQLRALVRREIMTLRAHPRLPDRGQYAFAQSLVREVAYATLTRDDRRSRHLAAARYFESLGTDELAGALAVQYESAYRNARSGPEAEALAVQAMRALRAAGERARSLGSPEQAQGLFEQAAAMATAAHEQAHLLELAGQAARDTGRGADAERLLRQAIELHRAAGDASAAARTTATLADALIFDKRLEAALSVVRPALSEFERLGDDPGRVGIMAELARIEMLRQVEPRLAVAASDEALAIAERLDLVPVVADLLVTRGTALASCGRSYEALGAIVAGRDLAAAHGLIRTRTRALVNASALLFDRDPRETVAASREALELAQRIGSRPQVVLAANNLGEGALEVGDWDLAIDVLDRVSDGPWSSWQHGQSAVGFEIRLEMGIDVADEVEGVRAQWRDELEAGEEERRLLLLELDGAIALRPGDWSTASRAYREAARINPFNATHYLTQAAIAALLGRDASAAREVLAAHEGNGAHGSFVKLIDRAMRAGVDALEGRQEDARSGLREARDGFRRMEAARPLALWGLVAHEVLGPDDPYAREATVEARAILERLGARAWLERLDELIAADLRPAAGSVEEPAVAVTGA